MGLTLHLTHLKMEISEAVVSFFKNNALIM